MTMDIAASQNNHGSDYIKMPSPKILDEQTNGDHTVMNSTISPRNSIKRSFDVAFLMLPDEKMSKKFNMEKQSKIEEEIDVTSFNDEDSSDIPKNYHRARLIHNEMARVARLSATGQNYRSPRVYDDPTILIQNNQFLKDIDSPKSAFTKVPNTTRLESPIPSSSPDQMSCPSNSPPISLSPPRNVYNFGGAFQPIQNLGHQQKMKQFSYRSPTTSVNSEIPAGYMPPNTTFPFTPNGHPSDLTGIVRHPAAAAFFSTLIPPAIASTFSLTAQNVCAKCNINFRMTSDLVYHMRSHHKNDIGNDFARRRREDKLKCPVCNESFRERHHLTRHMTAHQDKDGDDTESLSLDINHRQMKP